MVACMHNIFKIDNIPYIFVVINLMLFLLSMSVHEIWLVIWKFYIRGTGIAFWFYKLLY